MAEWTQSEKDALRFGLADMRNDLVNKIGKKPTDIDALGTTVDLVGVDGTGSNAAPLVETESRLDAIEAKLDALIASLTA